MPLYEFQCRDCEHTVELILKVGARAPKCEECGGRLAKKISAPAFQFKGSGWYITDYADNKASGETKTSGSEETPASESSATKPEKDSGSTEKAETKPTKESAADTGTQAKSGQQGSAEKKKKKE